MSSGVLCKFVYNNARVFTLHIPIHISIAVNTQLCETRCCFVGYTVCGNAPYVGACPHKGTYASTFYQILKYLMGYAIFFRKFTRINDTAPKGFTKQRQFVRNYVVYWAHLTATSRYSLCPVS